MRLINFLNEMTKKVKNAYKQVAFELMKDLSQKYNIKNLYDIEITSRMSNSGTCNKEEKLIQMNTSLIDSDTLYHELAHWIQLERRGESFCLDMRGRRGWGSWTEERSVVASEHFKLYKEIEDFSKKREYHKKIWDVLG